MKDEEINQIYDALDVAAKRYPMKALADEMPDKAESTLRNELIRQPGYKLGLVTALVVMEKTGDISALDPILKIFNRVAVPLPPQMDDMKDADWFCYAGRIAVRTGEVLEVMGKALADGKLSPGERRMIQNEVYEARQVMAALWFKLKEQG